MKKTASLLVLILFTVFPGILQAQSSFSGAYIGRFTTQERGESEQYMRLYNRVILRYEPSQSFGVRTALRRADFIQEETGSTRIYYGYVYWKPFSALDITAGRQYPYSKMIRRAVDGARVEFRFLPRWSLEGLAGVFAPEDRAGIIENPEDEHGAYLALRYQDEQNVGARASVYQRVSAGRIHNFAGLDAQVPSLFGASLYGFAKYNVSENLLQEAEGQLRREFGEKFILTVDARYRDPSFDIPAWYWQFAVEPYSTARIGIDYWVTNTESMTAEYFTRILDEKIIHRYRLGFMALNWTFGVVMAGDDQDETSELNIYGSLQHRIGRKLLVGAGANYFDYVFQEEYEEPLNAYGIQVFTKYRVLDALTAGVRGYYLINGTYSNDIRVLGELSYQF